MFFLVILILGRWDLTKNPLVVYKFQLYVVSSNGNYPGE